MAMQLTSGIMPRPKRITIYGGPGTGKTTVGTEFPHVGMLDPEEGTAHLEHVSRFPKPTSWNSLLSTLNELLREDEILCNDGAKCETLVIDTIDAMERLAMQVVAKSKGLNHFADFQFGKGDKALGEEFLKLVQLLEQVQAKHNFTVVLLAHAWVKRRDVPGSAEPFERYELKLTKHVAPLVIEWSDMLLFLNTKSEVENDPKDMMKKAKGVGTCDSRVMYSTLTDAHDGKTRYDITPEVTFTQDKTAGLVDYLLASKAKPRDTTESK